MSERRYDEEIAPKLMEVAKLCESAGLPFLATVWFNGEESGTTMTCPTKSAPFVLAEAAHRCGGNFDLLCIALLKQVTSDEHNGSLMLRILKGHLREHYPISPRPRPHPDR